MESMICNKTSVKIQMPTLGALGYKGTKTGRDEYKYFRITLLAPKSRPRGTHTSTRNNGQAAITAGLCSTDTLQETTVIELTSMKKTCPCPWYLLLVQHSTFVQSPRDCTYPITKLDPKNGFIPHHIDGDNHTKINRRDGELQMSITVVFFKFV